MLRAANRIRPFHLLSRIHSSEFRGATTVTQSFEKQKHRDLIEHRYRSRDIHALRPMSTKVQCA
jgi:hypothetical protein